MRSPAAKFAVLIIAVTVITVGLLALRHQRIRTAHQIMLQHKKINAARQEMWDMQLRIADLATPQALAQAIDRAHLELEPAVNVNGVNTLDK